MTIWRAVLIVYRSIDVSLPGHRERFRNCLGDSEIAEAVASFEAFPALVSDLTGGRAGICTEIVDGDHPLTSLSALGTHGWWPAPEDTRTDFSRQRRCHSIFVLWPANDFVNRTAIPSGGWGLGMGASSRTRGATYATVANAESWAWRIPCEGEVWLHEWLHGVCWHFARRGHRMPDGDADGADRHGYVRSPETGWTDYYRDLMNGNVIEQGEPVGIPAEAWSEPLDF